MTGAGAGGNSVRAGSVEALTELVRDIFTHPRARFVLKYRHADAKLSLRVTDDVKVRTSGVVAHGSWWGLRWGPST